MKKHIATVALVIAAHYSSFSQVGMGMAGGYSSKKSVIGEIYIKKQFTSNLTTSASFQIHANSSNPAVPKIFELREGYKYKFIEPYIGLGYHFAGQDSKQEYNQYKGVKPAYGVTGYYKDFTLSASMSGNVFTAKLGVYKLDNWINKKIQSVTTEIKTQSENSAAKHWYHISGNDKLVMGMQVIAGSADGLNQVLDHHIHTFERILPNANPDFWNPAKSMNNKDHKWVVISDGFHLTRGIEHTFNYASIAISMGDLMQYDKKDRWKVIAKKFVLSYIANRVGFVTVYNGIFNDSVERKKAGLK